jgi:glycosyltransferase involved in cell wall biosynthesis
MGDTPTVSVIVPNYNHARFLRQRLDTILAQTYQDFELILLDDCSTDDSREILREYLPRRAGVRLEFNESNSGSTFKQWNKGVGMARGKYVWIAESDDYANPRLLEHLVAVLDTDPGVTFAYCRSWRVAEDGCREGFADFNLPTPDRWSANFCTDGREMCEEYFLWTNPVPNGSAVVFRRATYERVGGVDEGLCLCGDWKLWAAMALEGKVGYLCDPMNHFRFHDGSVRSGSVYSGVNVAEGLHVITWLMRRVAPPGLVRERMCEVLSPYWVGALMSLHVSLAAKRSIIRDVGFMDAHPVRRAVRPALAVIRLKLRRHWRGVHSLLGPAHKAPDA